MAGLSTNAPGLWGGFAGLLYGSTSLSTPPGFLADATTPFSPASLFAASEPGVWYDPSDFSTMFQDSAGTTPVTAVEQPVGLILDKSRGLALGPELVTNGDFSDPVTTGWTPAGGTLSVVAEWLRLTSSASPAFAGYSFSSVGGATYVISGQWRSSAGSWRLIVGTGNGGSTLYAPSPGGTGSFTAYVQATGTTTWVSVRSSVITAGDFVEIDNISVKELAGNHATQATSASRPVLSARVNLLLATATLSTQNVTTLAATYTLAFTGAGTVTLSGTATGTYSAGTNSFVCTAGTLTLTVSGAVTLADLRVANTGVGLPAYQRVNTATDYDTTGFPYYLRFDGADDSMATGTITPGIDKAQVFAGVRKQSDAVVQILYELSNNANSNNGVFNGLPGYAGSSSTTGAYWNVSSKGTVLITATSAASFPAPQTAVQSHIADIAGDSLLLRLNTTQIAQSTVDQGTGNFLAHPLYIGARNNGTLRFNGNLYSLIVRFGANLDDTTISNTETWVNGKALAY